LMSLYRLRHRRFVTAFLRAICNDLAAAAKRNADLGGVDAQRCGGPATADSLRSSGERWHLARSIRGRIGPLPRSWSRPDWRRSPSPSAPASTGPAAN
jgi:hypothetical protein